MRFCVRACWPCGLPARLPRPAGPLRPLCPGGLRQVRDFRARSFQRPALAALGLARTHAFVACSAVTPGVAEPRRAVRSRGPDTRHFGWRGTCRLRQRHQWRPVGYASDTNRACRWRSRQDFQPVRAGDRATGRLSAGAAGALVTGEAAEARGRWGGRAARLRGLRRRRAPRENGRVGGAGAQPGQSDRPEAQGPAGRDGRGRGRALPGETDRSEAPGTAGRVGGGEGGRGHGSWAGGWGSGGWGWGADLG